MHTNTQASSDYVSAFSFLSFCEQLGHGFKLNFYGLIIEIAKQNNKQQKQTQKAAISLTHLNTLPRIN